MAAHRESILVGCTLMHRVLTIITFLVIYYPRIKNGLCRTNRGNPAHGGFEDAPDRKNKGVPMTNQKSSPS
jgi:hypothetical protein